MIGLSGAARKTRASALVIRLFAGLGLGLVFGLVFGLVMGPAGQASAGTLAERGRELAEAHCARCHVVSDDTRGGGISSTPSFMILISALKDWRDRFETFMARRPHPAHIRLETADARPEDLPATIEEVILRHDDLEALLAYVDTLASGAKAAD